jgi:hypothetical protein
LLQGSAGEDSVARKVVLHGNDGGEGAVSRFRGEAEADSATEKEVEIQTHTQTQTAIYTLTLTVTDKLIDKNTDTLTYSHSHIVTVTETVTNRNAPSEPLRVEYDNLVQSAVLFVEMDHVAELVKQIRHKYEILLRDFAVLQKRRSE